MALSRAAALWVFLICYCCQLWSCPSVQLPPTRLLSMAVTQAGASAGQDTGVATDAVSASAGPRSSQFDSESYLQQVFYAQKHVTQHSFPVKTILGVRFRGATLIYILTARKSGLAHIGAISKESFFPPRVVQSSAWTALFVGKDADCRQVERWAQHLQHFRRDHIPLVGKELAMHMADRAHRSTLSPRKRSLAVNAMILCTDSRSTGDLLTVDVSANYYFCRSGALGLHSRELCEWLERQGRQLAVSLSQQQDKSADDLDYCFRIADEAVGSQPQLYDSIRSGQVGVHALAWRGGNRSSLAWIPTDLFDKEQSSLTRSTWWRRHASIPTDSSSGDGAQWYQLSTSSSLEKSTGDQGDAADKESGNREESR